MLAADDRLRVHVPTGARETELGGAGAAADSSAIGEDAGADPATVSRVIRGCVKEELVI
jgi:hypothetical protein